MEKKKIGFWRWSLPRLALLLTLAMALVYSLVDISHLASPSAFLVWAGFGYIGFVFVVFVVFGEIKSKED